jgi:hypothetical protein
MALSPTLCIQFKTSFCTITDPPLYHTLQQCHAVIGTRQIDFSTSVDVTVTDIRTGAIMAELHYKKAEFVLSPEDDFHSDASP